MTIRPAIFDDEATARDWLEATLWVKGPRCPHCASHSVTVLKSKAHRAGLYQCKDCRKQFTVTVGTPFERSKIPLNKWLGMRHLLLGGDGLSTADLARKLDLPHKTVGHMLRRLRDAEAKLTAASTVSPAPSKPLAFAEITMRVTFTVKKPPRFRRYDPDAGHIFAERALLEEMEAAAELLQSEEDFGRAGVRRALMACYSYLYARGLSGQGTVPIQSTMSALDSVERGVAPELFDPRLSPGELPHKKRPRTPTHLAIKIHASALLDALMGDGLSEDHAAKRVAAYASGWPQISERVITATTVMNWRDELMQRPSADPDRKNFETYSRLFSEGPDARRLRDSALKGGPVMTGGVRSRRRQET